MSGHVYFCPHCGAYLPDSVDNCPCGFVIPAAGIGESAPDEPAPSLPVSAPALTPVMSLPASPSAFAPPDFSLEPLGSASTAPTAKKTATLVAAALLALAVMIAGAVLYKQKATPPPPSSASDQPRLGTTKTQSSKLETRVEPPAAGLTPAVAMPNVSQQDLAAETAAAESAEAAATQQRKIEEARGALGIGIAGVRRTIDEAKRADLDPTSRVGAIESAKQLTRSLVSQAMLFPGEFQSEIGTLQSIQGEISDVKNAISQEMLRAELDHKMWQEEIGAIEKLIANGALGEAMARANTVQSNPAAPRDVSSRAMLLQSQALETQKASMAPTTIKDARTIKTQQPASVNEDSVVASPQGKYVSKGRSSDFLEFSPDGTFSGSYNGQSMSGNYKVNGNTLTLTSPPDRREGKGRFSGNIVTLPNGDVYERVSRPAGTNTPIDRVGSIEGIVRQVSRDGSWLVIETDRREMITVRCTSSTAVYYRREVYRISNLEQGDRVRVELDSTTGASTDAQARVIVVVTNARDNPRSSPRGTRQRPPGRRRP